MHADMVARSWLVWDLTGSSTSVASVLVARAVPMLILGLIGGVAADRFDRRKLLMVIQIWTLLMHILMAVLLLAGNDPAGANFDHSESGRSEKHDERHVVEFDCDQQHKAHWTSVDRNIDCCYGCWLGLRMGGGCVRIGDHIDHQN